ncbi:ABC transporter substrate-binding protein [Anaeromassilibacillus senegalensis]|uniref:ABC transporter substrate-binding protein n=1 Tax=Anaeromassilibacillus senegalensis TaxID=1673717 RepID=UPI0006815B2C|nr:MqnA/MqnD/SBP family protein [Anaeromassilibacillus senegalensis]
MKITKKFTAMIVSFCLFTVVMAGCGAPQSADSSTAPSSGAAGSSTAVPSSEPEEKITIRIAAQKGPTGLGMVKLMSDSEADKTANRYEATVVAGPDAAVSMISSGEADVAAVPSNTASILYNKTSGNVQLAALNTLGVLYVVTDGETVGSIQDLKGKTIDSSGQGATPEYVLNYILEENGLEPGKDVTIEYKADHTELAANLLAGKSKVAVLPEPFVTQVTAKNPELKVALNLTDEWNKVAGDKSVLTMGCLVVRKEFAENNKAAFDAFLEEYKASIAFTNEHVDEAAELSEKYDIMPAAVAKKAIPNCNIVYIDGEEMQQKMPDFLMVLYNENPKSVGGELPGDDFYYKK